MRVERVLDGTAYATLVEAGAVEGPITAEGEAEKPTRKPPARKGQPKAASPRLPLSRRRWPSRRRRRSPSPKSRRPKPWPWRRPWRSLGPRQSRRRKPGEARAAAGAGSRSRRRRRRRGGRRSRGRRGPEDPSSRSGSRPGEEADPEEPRAEEEPAQTETVRGRRGAAKPKKKTRRGSRGGRHRRKSRRRAPRRRPIAPRPEEGRVDQRGRCEHREPGERRRRLEDTPGTCQAVQPRFTTCSLQERSLTMFVGP